MDINGRESVKHFDKFSVGICCGLFILLVIIISSLIWNNKKDGEIIPSFFMYQIILIVYLFLFWNHLYLEIKESILYFKFYYLLLLLKEFT